MRSDVGAGEEEEDPRTVLEFWSARTTARRFFKEFTNSVRKEIKEMDNATIIRIVAGVLFLLVLGLLIQRRRSRVK